MEDRCGKDGRRTDLIWACLHALLFVVVVVGLILQHSYDVFQKLTNYATNPLDAHNGMFALLIAIIVLYGIYSILVLWPQNHRRRIRYRFIIGTNILTLLLIAVAVWDAFAFIYKLDDDEAPRTRTYYVIMACLIVAWLFSCCSCVAGKGFFRIDVPIWQLLLEDIPTHMLNGILIYGVMFSINMVLIVEGYSEG